MSINVYKEWLGIPEEQCPPDYYALLRLVQFEDDEERIQGNYRKLNGHVRKYATGQYSKESQDLMNEIARAMLCLTDPIRKREYDKSLGREFKEATEGGRKSMGQAMIDDGIISVDQLKEAESYADARGLELRDAVVQMKLTDIETATQLYANELGISYIDLNETLPDDSVLDQVPRNLVKLNTFIPLFIDDDMLLIASADEPTPDLVDELRLRFSIPCKYALATPRSVNQAIAKYYAPGMREEAVETSTKSETKGATRKSSKEKKEKGKAKGKSAPETAEDASQKKMMGAMFICWSLIGSFFLGNLIVDLLQTGSSLTYLFMLLIGAPVTAWVTLVYWKK
ncbi:MAG: general secretion pathway protein GspE [Planctomycetaceae bacterium]|nr:general secretion pathway protein GspE [bacterium]MDC0274055.1 general secretion pathway protein GspE [Planctomycetaceae bacterium]MDG2389238.1 general secretion pathway protein GspE [Planctomycetaceae bacterium]